MRSALAGSIQPHIVLYVTLPQVTDLVDDRTATSRAVSGGASRLEAAKAAIVANPICYHPPALAPGVVTPGQIDLRAIAATILPHALRGKRPLAVGTFDG